MTTGRRLGTGILLAAVCICGMASAATSPASIGTVNPYQASNPAYQQAVAEGVQYVTGASADVAQNAVYGSSNGTFLPAAAGVIGTSAPIPPAGTQQRQTYNTLSAIFGGGSGGGALVTDLRTANGSWGTSVVNAGTATVGGIAGSIGNRQTSLLSERRALHDQVGSDSALAATMMNCNVFSQRIWVSPFYVHQNMREKDGYAGYKYDAGGASLGYDHAFGPVTVGGAFTYSHGKYKEKGANDDNKTDNYGVTLYGQYYHSSGLFFGVAGGYNYGDNEMARWVTAGNGWVRGDNHTDSYWVGGNVGYDFKLGQSFTLTPSTGLFWQESRGSAYNTTGVLGQSFSKVTSNALTLPVELNLEYRHELNADSRIRLNVGGGYSYDFRNKGATGSMSYTGFSGAQPVAIQGVKPGRHGWNAGAGVRYEYKQYDFSVNYRYDGKEKYNGHKVGATFGVNF